MRRRWLTWIALAATALGIGLAVHSQWAAIVGLDWARSWRVILLAALCFAVPPLLQAVSFWVALRLIAVRAPFADTVQIWARAYVLRYAPSGALAVLYRVRERERLAASSQEVLLATGYEHLGSLAAGAIVCVAAFLAAGGAPPLVAVGIAVPTLGLALAVRPRFAEPLLRRVATRFGLDEPALMRGRDLGLVVGLNVAGWLGTAAGAWVVVAGLAPGGAPSVARLTALYAVGYLVGFVVPFLPGGLGAREGTLVAVLAARYGAGVATALALTIRLVTTLGEALAVGLIELGCYLRMLTARAATSSTVTAETADSISISDFAQRVSGIASVGLKAIELVKET